MKRLLSCLLFIYSFSWLHAQATCNGVWGQYLVDQTFGTGDNTGIWYGPLANYAPGASTSTIFVGTAGPSGGILSDGYSGLAKVPSASNQGNWLNVPDHTGDPNGLMFLINAPSTAATVFFEYTMDNLCANTTMKLSVWILNVNDPSLTSNPTYQYPNMTLQAVDAVTGDILGSTESGDVPADQVWHQYSIVFNNQNSASIKLQLINYSVGSGYGNDLAIDDITVQPCVPESHILPKLDTSVCQSAVLNFNANVIESPYNPAEYQWQMSNDNGTTWTDLGGPSASTNYAFNTSSLEPGTYLVRFITGPQGTTSNYNCVALSDTSIINVVSFPRDTLNITTCQGNPYNFYGRYLGTSGTYDTLVIANAGDVCGTFVRLNLTVVPLPNVDVGKPNIINICEGDSALIGVEDPSLNANYQWRDGGSVIPGETGNKLNVATAGTYTVIADQDGCKDSSVVTINTIPLPSASIIYDDKLYCNYDTVTLNASNESDVSLYRWSPQAPFRMLTGSEGATVRGVFDQTTLVYLKAYNAHGCFATDSALVQVHLCCDILIPTAFSPNGDGMNDMFLPVLGLDQSILSFRIFDRYGKEVYSFGHNNKGWDGTYENGKPAANSTYMYYLQYTCGSEAYTKKGDITLVR